MAFCGGGGEKERYYVITQTAAGGGDDCPEFVRENVTDIMQCCGKSLNDSERENSIQWNLLIRDTLVHRPLSLMRRLSLIGRFGMKLSFYSINDVQNTLW